MRLNQYSSCSFTFLKSINILYDTSHVDMSFSLGTMIMGLAKFEVEGDIILVLYNSVNSSLNQE